MWTLLLFMIAMQENMNDILKDKGPVTHHIRDWKIIKDSAAGKER